MSKPARQLGIDGEAAAATYLVGQGFHILYRNYHTRYGEIDLIAERDGVIHCVEVKTRRSRTFGSAIESLTETKQVRLWKAILTFVEREHISAPYQVDAIILERRGDTWEFSWHEHILEDREDD